MDTKRRFESSSIHARFDLYARKAVKREGKNKEVKKRLLQQPAD